MLITLPNGKKIELETDKTQEKLGKDGITTVRTIVSWDSWSIKLPGATRFVRVNSSALDYYFKHYFNPDLKEDPHKKHRCVKDYPWQCPYLAQNRHTPCIPKQAQDKKELASIELTNWQREEGFMPEGKQLTLFHKGYWKNVNTGEELWTNQARPYVLLDTVCKTFAVASMEWLKRQCGFNGLKWRILPVTESQSDMDWVNKEQLKHSGRFSACVFDIFD